VGDSVDRLDGPPKVKGEFAYSSDLQAAGMLFGHTVRSPHPHARIVEVDIAPALMMPGVHAVLTHDDVPGKKLYGLEFPDQPVLAIDRVRYFGEPVALVAAEHPEQARRAAEAIARRRWNLCTEIGRPWGTATVTIRGRTSSGTW
jgi:CO/xanthine dehydrogenase Mo-binding subunit